MDSEAGDDFVQVNASDVPGNDDVDVNGAARIVVKWSPHH